MAITRLFQTGFEANGTTFSEYGALGTGSPTISSSSPKTGTYCLTWNGNYKWFKVAPGAIRQVRAGFFWKAPYASANNSSIWSLSQNGSATLLVDLRLQASGNMELYVAGSKQATITSVYPTADWKHIGVDVKIHSSAGWATVYIDGVQAATFSGNTGNVDIEYVNFGNNSNENTGSQAQFMDDAYLDNTTGEGAAAVCPGYRYEYITPNGNGNYSEGAGSDGNSVDNYLLVDDRPHDSDTTYSEADTSGERDTYAMTTVTIVGTIVSVIPVVFANKSDVGTDTEITLTTRYDSTDQDGSSQNLPTAYGFLWERFTAKPGGGAWDQTALDAVEVGWEGSGTF